MKMETYDIKRTVMLLVFITAIAVFSIAVLVKGREADKKMNLADSDSSGYEAVLVLRIVDGDTVLVQHEDGERDKVRFIGVNCPETAKSDSAAEPYAEEAMNFTQDTLSGKTVYISKDKSETDKYGRLLRFVWLSIPEDVTENSFQEESIEGLLLEQGLAEVMTIKPDNTYAYFFESLEETAKNAEVGIWNNAA